MITLYTIQISTSRFGFCGTGEGFCTPSTKVDSNNRNRNRDRNRARPASRARPAGRGGSGYGCELEDVEWVGGDLPTVVGGGGIELDRDTEDECFERLLQYSVFCPAYPPVVGAMRTLSASGIPMTLRRISAI